MKKALPSMEKRFRTLTKQLKSLEPKLIEDTIRAERRDLRRKERQLKIREHGIESEVSRLREMEHEVEDLEARKSKAFEDYLRGEVMFEKSGGVRVERSHKNIMAMIDEARNLLAQNDIDHAARLTAEIELLVEGLKNKEERRLFEYDIRDLKTSIKLAELG